MVDMGISSNIMKSPSPGCYMTFWDMTIYNDTLNLSDITPICELITELDFHTDFDLITEFWRRLSSKLLKQGYLAERLKSSFRKFYGRYGDLIQQYEVSLSRMLNDILILDQQ